MKHPQKSLKSTPRVAILIETTRSYTRDMLSGVRRYLAAHGPWSCFVELRALDSDVPAWLRSWRGDGILTRTHSQEMADLISETGVPAVELRSPDLDHKFPFVGMDNTLIGRSVADHFLARGYRNFAVYRVETESFFRERNSGFIEAVKTGGSRCDVLTSDEDAAVRDWDETQNELATWLENLPKPVGLFGTNDALAMRVLDACQLAEIRVPEDVAVVGTENEETLCAFARPELTSIAFDGETVGFRAAELLDRMMNGPRLTKREREPVLISPKGIVLRQSSDEFMIGDRLVARAMQIIREEACEGLTVEPLCRRLSVSRSTLERRMKAAINRSPKAEMLRLRFRRVEELLRSSNFTIEVIAERCGFQHAHYLQTAFRERYGTTPARFRRSFSGNLTENF